MGIVRIGAARRRNVAPLQVGGPASCATGGTASGLSSLLGRLGRDHHATALWGSLGRERQWRAPLESLFRPSGPSGEATTEAHVARPRCILFLFYSINYKQRFKTICLTSMRIQIDVIDYTMR